MATYNWYYHGTLNCIESNNNKGVYLLVYNGNPKRIIYVGATNCFIHRLYQHKDGYLRGSRTIWRIGEEKDIYNLMSFAGLSSRTNQFKYYASLAQSGKLWAHTTLEKNIIENDLNKYDDFSKDWEDYVRNLYINKIEIWTCSMDESLERIALLESQIQRAFKSNFFIGSYINAPGMCFLGKIETPGSIFSQKFIFNTLPDLDESSRKLMRNLTDKIVTKFSKSNGVLKRNTKKEELLRTRMKFKFAFTKWDPQEFDILITCRKLGITIDEIAEKYLYRTPKEVEQKIIHLNHYYNIES